MAEVLVAIIGLVAAFVIYRWQRQRKGLAVAVLTNRSLLATPSPFAVSVHHDGKIVGQPSLIVLRVANTGNVPIEADDFERPLSITFLYCEVLSAEVTGTRPDDLTASLRIDGPTVTFDPILLNPTDLIEIQCLLDGSVDDLRAECRVVGVRSVPLVELPRDSWGKVWRVSTVEVVVLALGPVLVIGVGVPAFIAGGLNVFFGVATLLIGGYWLWSGLQTIRRSRLWLTLPPPKGH